MPALNHMRTILVGEDELEVRHYLELALRCQGYSVALAENGEEVLSFLGGTGRDISLVLLDIMMPRKDGMETLREIRRSDRDLPIIMLSGASSPLRVVEAIKKGATDFLAKPVSHEDLGAAIEKALQSRPGPWTSLPDPITPPTGNELFYSSNPRMRAIVAALEQIGASEVPVLLQGESGVGKEVLARQLHEQSPRSNKPFLKLNCAALPSELLESELFGYERGAFTGAFKNKPGKFEMADGGTILLDEIGDMDFRLQAKLLQVLQDHEFQRLGGKDTVRVNVRVLAATHCDLKKAILEGRFREDLYYRLDVISIQVPPLRERQDEILPLADLFLMKHGAHGIVPPEITPPLRQALLSHDWPGNIRELENVMRRFLVFRDQQALAEELLFNTRRKETASAPPDPLPPSTSLARQQSGPPIPDMEGVSLTHDQAQAEAILRALHATHWNRRRAAALLQMDYKALLYKMKILNLEEHVISFPVPAADSSAPQQLKAPVSVLDQVNQAREQAEIEAILTALHATHWNRKQAAARLKIAYKALLYKMKKFAIEDQVLVLPHLSSFPEKINGAGL